MSAQQAMIDFIRSGAYSFRWRREICDDLSTISDATFSIRDYLRNASEAEVQTIVELLQEMVDRCKSEKLALRRRTGEEPT